MSVACLAIFLLINDKKLNASENEMTEQALALAMTSHSHNFSTIKSNLEKWIEERIIDFKLPNIE